LSQLGLKIQHALRAFTAKDRKAIKLTAQNYPISDYYDTADVLTSLGIGEAFISALDEKGRPSPLAATLLRAPASRMDVLTDRELSDLIADSELTDKYNEEINRESAEELLQEKIEKANEDEIKEKAKAEKEKTRKKSSSTRKSTRQNPIVKVLTSASVRTGSAQKEFLDTARQQRIAYDDGLFMLYHWKGDGPTLLLLHGWESNSFRWQYVLPELQKRNYNIIAIDAPAHGMTDGKLFTAIKYAGIIKTVNSLYQPEIIMAHSVGAMATVYSIHHYPNEALKKLILLGSPNSLEVIMKGYQQLLSFNNRVYKGLNELLKTNFGYYIKDFKSAAFAKAISTETLLLHAQADLIVPATASQQIHKSMPNSELHITNSGGHSLHTEENTGLIMDFLDRK